MSIEQGRQGFVDDEDVIFEDPPVDGIEEELDAEPADDVAEPDDAPADDEPADERDWEAEAVKLGWHSNGPKTAKEFVEDGEEYGLGLKRQIQMLREESQRELEATRQMAQAALDRQREQLESQYDRQIRSAVEVGDVDTYDQLSRSKAEGLRAFEPKMPEATPPAADPGVVAWKATHSEWFDKDPGMTSYAVAEFGQLIAANPDVSQVDLLPALDAKLQKVFPAAYGVTERRTPRRLTDTGGRRNARGPKKNPTLNASERQAAKMFIEQGLYRDEAEYAADYFKHKNGEL